MRSALPLLVVVVACTGKGGDTADTGGHPHDDSWLEARTCTGFASTPETWELGAPLVADYFMYSADGLGDYWSVVDLTGDGVPDLVQHAHGSQDAADVMGASWYVWPGTGSGFGARISWALPLDHRDIEGMHAANSVQEVMDLDSDGFLDLVFAIDPLTGEVAGTPDAPAWTVYFGDGATGFASTPTLWTLPALDNPGEVYEGQTHHVADLDGDGSLDLIETLNGGANFGSPEAPVWRLHPTSGTGFSDSYVEWALPPSRRSPHADYETWAETDAVPLDVTGDGLLDYVLPRDASWPYAVYGEGPDWHWLVYVHDGTGFSDEAWAWSIPDEAFTYPSSGADAVFPTSSDWRTISIGGGTPSLVVSHDFELDAPFVEDGLPIWAIFDATADGYADLHEPWAVPDPVFTAFWSNGGGSDEGWFTRDMDDDGCDDLVLTAGLDLGHPEPGDTTWRWWVYKGE